MKTDKKMDPQSTNRNEDKNQLNPTTTGSTHLNQQTTRTPQTPQKEEKEVWEQPDPSAPQKKHEVYAGDKKDRTANKQQDEDYDDEGITDEDADVNPRAEIKNTETRKQETDDIDRGSNYNDQINP